MNAGEFAGIVCMVDGEMVEMIERMVARRIEQMLAVGVG